MQDMLQEDLVPEGPAEQGPPTAVWEAPGAAQGPPACAPSADTAGQGPQGGALPAEDATLPEAGATLPEAGATLPEADATLPEAGGPPPQAGVSPQADGLSLTEEPGRAETGADAQLEQAVSGALLLERELLAIRADNPDIGSYAELAAHPRFGEMLRLVERGCTPSEAHRLVCFDEILARQRRAAAREAVRSAIGRAHLTATDPAVGDGFSVPREIERQYRAFFPDWSEAQIRADYRKRMG